MARLPENSKRNDYELLATLIQFCARASVASTRGRFRAGHL